MSDSLKPARLKDLPDDRLIKLTLEGTTRAFDELVRRHSRRLHAMLVKMVNSDADAYDIAQESFMKAYQSLRYFNGKSAFYTWLHTIAANQARNFIRKRKKFSNTYSINNDVNGDPLEKNAELRDTAREADPIRGSNIKDLKKRLAYALDQLSPAHREVVMLCDIAEMSYSDIANMLNVSEGTLRSRLHYAHRHLQSLLQDDH